MSGTPQPEALRLARKFEEVGFMGDHRFAQDHWCRQAAAELRRQHARIEELEAELAALKAAPAKVTVEQVVELEVDDLIDRLLNAQQDLNLAANVHMDQSIASASTLLDEVEIALRTLAATHPTQQGLELANCKGGKWLTVVYRDIQPGDESRTIGEHPKVSALSWSHALHDRDAALAAKAKHGGAQQ